MVVCVDLVGKEVGVEGHLVGVLLVHRPVDHLVHCIVGHLVGVVDQSEELEVGVGVGRYYHFIGVSHRLLVDSSPCLWANER